MKLKLLFFLPLSSLLLVAGCATKDHTKAFDAEYQALVIKVVDGDTIDVNHNNDIRRIRLSYIDAPEIKNKQHYGVESKLFLSNILLNKKVIIYSDSKGKYGRSLGEVYIYNDNNSIYVNAKMIKSGNAWVYEKYRKNEYLINLENFARTNKLGLWTNNTPIEPWVFRKTKK